MRKKPSILAGISKQKEGDMRKTKEGRKTPKTFYYLYFINGYLVGIWYQIVQNRDAKKKKRKASVQQWTENGC